jgi:hypothetical protein
MLETETHAGFRPDALTPLRRGKLFGMHSGASWCGAGLPQLKAAQPRRAGCEGLHSFPRHFDKGSRLLVLL